MDLVQMTQTMSGLAGILMILMASDWLKKHLRQYL